MRQHPTEQELRDAYAYHRARKPAGWPDTFEEAMADPMLSRALRITAMHPPRAQRKPAQQRPTTRFVFVSGHANPLSLSQNDRRFTVIDRKRAAAGDRDDD